MPLKRSKWDESDDDSNESEPDDVHAAKSRRIDAEERRPTPELDVQELVLANFVRPNGQLDIPSAELGKLKASHGVAALAKGLCLAIASGSGAGDGFVVGRGHPLPYPYKRHFMGDVARKFQALQEFPWDRRLITKPYHKIDGLASKTHMFRDTTFDEGHLRVCARRSHFERSDSLRCRRVVRHLDPTADSGVNAGGAPWGPPVDMPMRQTPQTPNPPPPLNSPRVSSTE